MIQLLGGACALGLYAAPLAALPTPAVAGAGLLPLLLAVTGLAGRWRRPVTVAACLFVAEYAAVRWLVGGPADVLGAAAVGLGLVVLLEAADLAGRTREAHIGAGVVAAQLARWIGLAALTLAAVVLGSGLAVGLASALPSASAPVLAAAGALGVVLLLAGIVVRAGRARSSVRDAASAAGDPFPGVR